MPGPNYFPTITDNLDPGGQRAQVMGTDSPLPVLCHTRGTRLVDKKGGREGGRVLYDCGLTGQAQNRTAVYRA